MAGQDDLWAWLQSLQPNQGAAQPYGPGGVPGPYSGGPEGLMPGGGLMGRQGATPGAPSMGYPAMGKFSAQPSPSPSPIAAAIQAAPAGDDGGFNNPYQAASQANPAQGGPYVGGQGVAPGIGAYPDSTNYPHTLTPPGAPRAPPRPADAASQTYPHMPWPDTGASRGPLASPDAPAAAPMKRRAGAANLGYYQPTSGNAQRPTWTPYTNPDDPRIYRG